MFFFFLLSGLFLGWSLGANDAANVYGTAVGTRMIRFRTAALLCSLFVLIGAVVGGAGAAHTLGRLGAVNALPGSFTVALAAGLTVTWMTKLKLPVSTSQAVVGAIVGWNFFSGGLTDAGEFTKIVSSWVLCPILSALFAVGLYKATSFFLSRSKVHMFRLDAGTRWGLIIVGAFASYSLGANNIANVMGVFVPAAPFGPLDIMGLSLTPGQQLFFLGALAIGVGVFTYSKKVMLTVGNDLFRLSPIAALLVVLAQALVLFLFSSETLERWFISAGLPPIPLVPVSSSQAVIGAVIGIGLAKGGRNIHFRVLGRIATGWVSTPVIAAFVAFFALFVVQNVFSQEVYRPVRYLLSVEVADRLQAEHLDDDDLDDLLERAFPNARSMMNALNEITGDPSRSARILELCRVRPMVVDVEALEPYYDYSWYSEEQIAAVFRLHGRRFDYEWQLREALAELSDEWVFRPRRRENRLYNRDLDQKLSNLYHLFDVSSASEPAR